MKVCILKQPYITEFTWLPHRWSNAQELLNNYILRSQNFGLVCEKEADIWVVEDGGYVSDTYFNLLTGTPEAVEALYRSHITVKWADVPWDEYDVVISLDPIVHDQIIEQYPRILWCYYEQEHSMSSFKRSANRPFGKYDLFLNHALSSSTFSTTHLPRSLNFPYLCSRRAFSQVISVEKHNRVYLDSHCIRGISDLELLCAQLEQKFGIEVTHSIPWDFDNSYKCVGDKVPSSTHKYLSQLASCKYFLLNRGGLSIGQAAPEAAALGVIVLSDKGQIYSRYLCHPETWVEPRDYDSAAEVIKKIQGNTDLQREIIDYQFERVQDFFLERPLKVLRECLEIKRGAERSHCSRSAVQIEPPQIMAKKRLPFANYWKRASFSKILKDPMRYLKKLLRKILKRAFFVLKQVLPLGLEERLIELKKRRVFLMKTFRCERVPCQKLSVIFAGRNDSYATNFKERVMAAVNRNQAEAAKRGLEVEWIFVEWNPLSKNYLSYDLAKKGFRCYVVSPGIHERIINPRVANRMSFMQFLAKNVGIRRATGDWILVTNADCVFDDNTWDFVANQKLCPYILYRAERCDIDLAYFDKPFEVMRTNVSRCHSVQGGRHFTQGAGDFVLFSSRDLMGYDEGINFSDAHIDGRFCLNWSALRSGGDLTNWYFFRFIGQVFKADHELIFARTQHLVSSHHKGFVSWNSHLKTHNGVALYQNDEKWGLANGPEIELCEGVWYIG